MSLLRLRTGAAALLLCASASAQESKVRPIQATELWSSVGVNGGLPRFFKSIVPKTTAKRFRLAAEVGYRSADVFFAGRQVYVDLGGRYRITEHLTAGLEHRVAFRGQDPTRHRSGVQLMYDASWKRFDLDYRFNYQHNYREFGGQREMFRNRFGVEYNIPGFKLDPAFSAEFFTWAGYMGWRYTGVRYKMGTTWSLSKAHEIDLSIVHDREVGIAWPTHRWIWSVSYTMDLRKL